MGRKWDMRCRVPKCKNRSKGPRFRYMCEEHVKLPKKVQIGYLEQWKKTHKPHSNGVSLDLKEKRSISDIVHDAVESGLHVEVILHSRN